MKKEYILFLVPVAILAAAGILFLKSYAMFSVLIFLPVFLFLCVAYPKPVIYALAFFLLLQDLMAKWAANDNLLAIFIKRIEEIIIIMVFLSQQIQRIMLKKPWKASIIDIPLIILLLLAVISSLKNHFVPHLYALYDFGILIKGYLVFFIFYNFEFSPDYIFKLTRVFLAVAVSIALIGLVDLFFPVLLRSLLINSSFVDYRFGIASVQSIFTHPTVFGWGMACAMLFSLACLFFLNNKRYLFLVIFFAFSTIISMRIKSIGGMLFGMSVGLSLVPAVKKIRAVFILSLFMLAFVLLFGARSKLLIEDNIYMYFQSPYYSDMARNALYLTSFQIARDFFPLGAGLGTFGGWISALNYSPLYNRYGLNMIYGLQESGNFLMDTFWPYLIGEAGIIGMIIYVFIIGLLLFKITSILNRTDNIYIKIFSLGTAMVLSEAIIASVGEPIFLKPPQYFFIFACLGISCSLERFAKSGSLKNENPHSQ